MEKGHWVIEDKLVYRNVGSTNGLIYNHSAITVKILSDGDFIRIDDGVETIPEGVLFVFSSSDSENRWRTVKCTPLSRQIFFNFKLDFGGVIEAQSTPSLPSLGYPLSVDI